MWREFLHRFMLWKFKQTYQTTKTACSQERRHPNGAPNQIITNGVQWPSMKIFSASGAYVDRESTMGLIHILFSKIKKYNNCIFLIDSYRENIIIYKNKFVNTYMIMICEEHLLLSIGEKIDGDVHSTHDFISIRQYCFTADMVSWTEKQKVFRSSLCHFPIPKECTIFWKYPISESAPVSRNINLWWQLQLKIWRWMLHF